MGKRLIIGWIAAFVMVIAIGGSAAQSGVRAVVVNEFLNIRISPAIGAPVIDTVEAGYLFEQIDARSGGGDWLRVDYECQQGWINVTPLVILSGDINALPVADPRSIPFGGFEAPRSGPSDQTGPIEGVATDGLRVRSGPSTAYPTLANINFNQLFTITGRNDCGTWYQVNWEGTLGWVSADFVQLRGGSLLNVPVDGIVADTAPVLGEGEEDFINTLRLMLNRLDIAQVSLDEIRRLWTDAALNGRAVCQAYPPQPSNLNVPVPLLAANFVVLDPLVTDFNDAMTNVRNAIDLYIAVCNQPGTGNPVGTATVTGALNIINVADTQFPSLRQRINDQIPEVEGVGPNECLLRFDGKAEILPRIEIGPIYGDEFTRRTYARGYCFDGVESQVLNIQALPIPPAPLEIFVAVSPLDNPTDFILSSQGPREALLTLGPVILPRATTYLLIIADIEDRDEGRLPIGQYAFTLTDLTFTAENFGALSYDPETDSVFVDIPQAPVVDDPLAPDTVCPGFQFTCNDFFTCAEAQACYRDGNFSLDEDGDGVPCDALCQP